jgi:hypothetical protein
MADQGTITAIAGEIGSAFETLAVAFTSSARFASFMELLGWDMNDVPTALTGLAAPSEKLASIFESGELGEGDVPGVLAAIAGLVGTVNGIASQPTGNFPAGLDVAEFKAEFPRQLIDYLIVTYLLERQGGWGNLLKLMGVIRLEDKAATASRPAYTHRTIAWEDLGNFFSDPGAVLGNAYRWNQPDFDGDALFQNTADLLDGWHMPNRLDPLDPAMLAYLTAGASGAADDLWPVALRAPLFEERFSGVGLEAGLQLFILPQTAASNPGFAILPYASGDVTEELPLTDALSAAFSGNADFAGGIAILVRPTKPVDVAVGISGGAPSAGSADLAAGLVWRPATGTEIVLIGSSTGSRLHTSSIAVRVGGHVDTSGKAALFLETQWTQAGLVIQPEDGEADSFLSSLLPAGGLAVNFDFTLGISTSSGVYFSGSGGLEISVPTHVQLGPVELQSVLLGVKPSAGHIPITLGATMKGDLSVLTAVVEDIGLLADFTFPADHNGNLGPVNLGLKFKPPKGVGLSVNAGVVTGGGYLYIDVDRGEYAGALQLSIANFLSVAAIGLISTKMPDGSKGFSLLIIITADFGAGIQLGFGFTLLAVGGLVGLNRAMLFQPLMDGIRSDAIESIMFPQNVIANAPRIISDLRAIFPPQGGTFLIGPMAKLGWGTPTLISLALGVIIEIPPGDVVILGVLKVALPTDDVSILKLQVNFAGALEFDKQRFYFFASLYDSHLLFITIDGEMGVLFAYGNDANFVIAVGGFHPQFNPPPLPFPTPKRISINIINESFARIHADGYFAVTTNTVQFGTQSNYFFGFSALSVEGNSSFDALIQFSPFHFIVHISTSFSVKVFGLGVYGVGIDLSLEGPARWHVHGTASLSFFFFSVDIGIDFSWGDSPNTVLPPIAVMPILAAEFGKQTNWKAVLPTGSNLLVSLRKLPGAEAAFVLHPVGTLQVSQRAIPLDLSLDKVGSQAPSDANRFALTVTASNLTKTRELQDLFAPSQFKNFDDAAKLSQPAFVPQDSGIELSGAGNTYASGTAITRIVRYDLTTIDTTFAVKQRFFSYSAFLFAHFLGGSSVALSKLSSAHETLTHPYTGSVKVAAETFAVAFQSNNTVYHAEAASFNSQASAHDYMARVVTADPSLAGNLHVLPHFEVAA